MGRCGDEDGRLAIEGGLGMVSLTYTWGRLVCWSDIGVVRLDAVWACVPLFSKPLATCTNEMAMDDIHNTCQCWRSFARDKARGITT
jgi:hypothetical protein